MSQGSKENKEPFGGTARRIQIIAPTDTPEKVPTYKEKAEELKANAMQSVDRESMELEAARIRTETAKLNLQYQDLMSRLPGGGGAAVPAAGAPFTGTTAALFEILQLGQKTGIDVTPLIRQVLTGQGTLMPPAPAPAQSTEGIPNPLMQAFSHIIEKSFENNTKPREDAKMAVMEERLKNQELLINKELGDLKDLLKQRLGGEVKDPTQAAADSIRNMTLLVTAVKALSPEPAPAPVTGNSAELAFKYQDRQWGHEEAKLNAEVERQKIVANIEIEAKKLEQGRDNLAQIPQMIGAVVAQSLMESGKNKGATPAAAPQKQRINLAVSKSKSLPHGVISIKCPDCQQEVSFATSAKTANCVACGVGFNIILKETEGGPTNVETTDIPVPAAPAPETEQAASDDYLFSRNRGQ